MFSKDHQVILPVWRHIVQPPDPDAGKDRGQEEKGATKDEMVTDREAWRAAVRGVTKSQTRLSD